MEAGGSGKPIVDFVVVGQPRTPNSGSKQAWKDRVAAAATAEWTSGRPPLAAEIAVTIVFFFEGETNIDIDNIVKPILDALEGVVIEDDRHVSQVIARKTDQSSVGDILNPPKMLTQYLRQMAQFVYVAIKGPPEHRRLPDERT